MATKSKPVPLEKLKFSGDAQFTLVRLKAELAERDQYITALEDRRNLLDRAADRVFHALEEAENMAVRFDEFIQEATNNPPAYKRRTIEFQRYARLFREAKDDWQRIRQG